MKIGWATSLNNKYLYISRYGEDVQIGDFNTSFFLFLQSELISGSTDVFYKFLFIFNISRRV
jgi:hypothetical protein